jgi:hypothetical protein
VQLLRVEQNVQQFEQFSLRLWDLFEFSQSESFLLKRNADFSYFFECLFALVPDEVELPLVPGKAGTFFQDLVIRGAFFAVFFVFLVIFPLYIFEHIPE